MGKCSVDGSSTMAWEGIECPYLLIEWEGE